ncbi:MAG: hypothetical protein OK449_08970 [Thaumarchaeota archaeon]|nr:hypothetical protein [Nitrososphaerota archaeon]
MNRATQAISIGVLLLVGAIVLDLAGSALQSIFVLIISFALAIAGAVVALRGVIDYLGEAA